MELAESNRGDVVVISLSAHIFGDTDCLNLKDKVKNLISKSKHKIVFEMKNVKLINSVGIGILMACWTSLANVGGKLKMVNVCEKVKGLLEITELDQFFETSNNLDETINSF